MARKADPHTPYIVRDGIINGYRYAYVQKMVERGKPPDLVMKRRKVFLGTLNNDNVFEPNKTFRLMDINERRQLIFPKNWDISIAQSFDAGPKNTESVIEPINSTEEHIVNNPTNVGIVKKLGEQKSRMPEESIEEQQSIDATESAGEQDNYFVSVTASNLCNSCKIYGSVWLMEQIAEKKGLIEDLITVFDGDICAVNDVLTLAIYVIVESRSFNRIDRWLNTHKALSDHRFGSDYVTRFTQTITEDHRLKLIGARVSRQPKGSVGSIDSSSRSGYGKCLVNLRYGHNKDRDDLPCTLEVYVYSLTTHEPIYYKRMPGNTSDMVTIRIIITDLKELGIREDDLTFMTDRGYCSKENMGIFHKMGYPFLMCAKINQMPVINCLMQIEYDEIGLPTNMEYDAEAKLYYTQRDAADFDMTLEDGTLYTVHGIKVNMFMNPDERLADATRIKQRIQEEKKMVAEYESGRKPIPLLKTLNTSLNYYSGKVDKETGKITFIYKKEAADKSYAQCGFFASCMYKYDMNGIEAYREYKTRDEHEKNFFCLKQDEGADMQDCSSEEGAEGRGFIYFVGLIMLNTLKHTWKTKLKPKIKTSYDVLDAMEEIRFSEYISGNSHMTTFTTEQIEICDAFGIQPPIESMTSTAKEQWRKKHNPKKRGRKTKSENKVSV